MSIQELFEDRQYVNAEIARMREAWGSKSTFNNSVIDASRQTLAFMYLYAPIDMLGVIDASLYELNRREQFLLFGQ